MRARSSSPELLDARSQDPVELARALDHVARVNRWLGGVRALRMHLEPLLELDGVLRILDVGTGNGCTLAEVTGWALGRGRSWTGVGLDRSAQVLSVAARQAGRADGTAQRFVQGDGLHLPFADSSVDAALCTLTLHHFSDEEAVALLREMARASRGPVLACDLERNAVNYAGAQLLASTAWRRSPTTRNDGPLSVLRSFTPGELLDIGRRAGLRDAHVRRHFPWRLVLEGRA
jgi:SAM-dependent methyltransferase